MAIKIIRKPNNITIAYTEIKLSPTETIRSNNNSAVRIFEVLWDDRFTFAKQMTGYTTQDVIDGVTIVYIYEPHPYPSSSIKNLFAKESNIAGIGAMIRDPAYTTQKVNRYVYAQVTISYETPSYELGADVDTVYVSESLEPASEFLTMKTEGLGYSDGVALDDGEAPGKIIRMMDWVYTIHELNEIPPEIIVYPGFVNLFPVESKSLGLTFPIGTLLFGNPSLERKYTSDGATAWTVTLRFTYRPNGWNYFPRVVSAGGNLSWQAIYPVTSGVVVGGAINFYPFADFSNIII